MVPEPLPKCSAPRTDKACARVHLVCPVCVQGQVQQGLLGGSNDQRVGAGGWRKDPYVRPQRRADVNFTEFSFVLSHPLK